MRDRGLIAAGVLVFVGAATFPAWYGRATGMSSRPPDLQLPAQERRCVLPRGEMRERHMALLLEWRDLAVRSGVRSYTAPDGRTYAISLTRTCLGCHTDKAAFCDRCHTYASVAPYCWDCHVDPAAGRRSQ